MKKLFLSCILALTMISGATIAYPADPTPEQIERTKATMLGKILATTSIQDQIFADGFEFTKLQLEEADDGGTEPLFVLFTAKYFDRSTKVLRKCYYVEFDTDRPNKLPKQLSELAGEECDQY